MGGQNDDLCIFILCFTSEDFILDESEIYVL